MNNSKNTCYQSQHHSFDITLAQEYGIEEAIIIHHLQHWITINKRLKKNFEDGRTWTYQTRNYMSAVLPYMTYEQIKYTCTKLEESGVIKIANYNKMHMDKTLWYAFTDEDKFIPNTDANSKNVYDRENSLSTGKIPYSTGKIPYAIPDTKETDTKDYYKAAPKPPAVHNSVKKTVVSTPIASKDAHVSSKYAAKKIKEDKEPEESKSRLLELAAFLLKSYNSYRKSLDLEPEQPKSIKSWNLYMNRIEKKHSKEKIKEIIAFTFRDSFWKEVIKSPKSLENNFNKLEEKLARLGKSSAETANIYEENVEWIKKYTDSRAESGAYGILLYNSENAWDQNSKAQWSMRSPELKEKIYKFYAKYRN